MQLFIASDHRGFDLKNYVKNYLESKGYEVVDIGDKKLNPIRIKYTTSVCGGVNLKFEFIKID